jgi:hypothetical protein
MDLWFDTPEPPTWSGTSLELRNVDITKTLQALLFADLRQVLPMKLLRLNCKTLTIDLLTIDIQIDEVRLTLAPFDHDDETPPTTREQVDLHARRMLRLLAEKGARAPPRDWRRNPFTLGLLTSLLGLSSNFLLPRIQIARIFMHHTHLDRGVPTTPFGVDICAAEALLFWLCVAYPGAGALPSQGTDPRGLT